MITYESIAYGSAVRLLALPALQAAGGTATIMPTFGAVLTGAATAATGAGLLVASTDGQPDTSGNLLQRAGERITRLDKSDGDDCGNPPQHTATAREEYLTPLAVSAIVKAWDVGAYDPPRTDCATWLDKVHDICEQYEIPEKQRARCASHHMGPHSQEAVRAAGCYSMTWDEFAAWIRQYDCKLCASIPPSVPCQQIHQIWRERVPRRRWRESPSLRSPLRWGMDRMCVSCVPYGPQLYLL